MSKIARLMVATDLTERSQRAFERAIELKNQPSATITLLHVVEPGLFRPIGEKRYADAEDFLRDQVAALPDERRAGVACAVRVGEPFTTIIDEAHRQSAELIVLGQPAKGSTKELFIGTTTERVVRYSDLPVLVVKQTFRGAYQRVLVAMDLSHGAMRALQAAYLLAPEAEFLVLHAWDTPLMGFGTSDPAERAVARENQRVRDLVARRSKELLSLLSPHAAAPRFELIESSPYAAIRNQQWAPMPGAH
jgi:nucleotide-binding universal stress UspA family protein